MNPWDITAWTLAIAAAIAGAIAIFALAALVVGAVWRELANPTAPKRATTIRLETK